MTHIDIATSDKEHNDRLTTNINEWLSQTQWDDWVVLTSDGSTNINLACRYEFATELLDDMLRDDILRADENDYTVKL